MKTIVAALLALSFAAPALARRAPVRLNSETLWFSVVRQCLAQSAPYVDGDSVSHPAVEYQPCVSVFKNKARAIAYITRLRKNAGLEQGSPIFTDGTPVPHPNETARVLGLYRHTPTNTVQIAITRSATPSNQVEYTFHPWTADP